MRSLQRAKITPEEEAGVLLELEAMEGDKRYNTPSRYSVNTTLYPENAISFAEFHVAYMRKYPEINPEQYIQNLKMITLVR